jgi:anti-sigma factor RsiW
VNHNAASDLLGVYVLDSCEEAEAADVQEHVNTCDLCAEETARLGELAGWLGASEAASPSSELRSRVLGEARDRDNGD